MESQRIAGRYEVLRAIGRGGMGVVWLCRDDVLGRQVAVKQIGGLPGEPEVETARAMREARAAAALNHPNAVAAYDVVDHEGRPYLVMEYVEGRTLGEIVTADGPLDSRRVADIGAQLAGALAAAHDRGIVHRDVKAGNVLVDGSGKPKISDFGIARSVGDDQLTQTGLVSGTPAYLSPELARGGDPDPKSDVWALGATLYVAAEGRPPYAPRENSLALLSDISTTGPLPMSRASAPLAAVIESMMHRDPSARPDMRTAGRRLADVAAGADVPAPAPAVEEAGPATRVLPAAVTPPPELPRTPPPVAERSEPSRRRLLVPVLAALLLLAVIGAVYALTRPGGDGSAGRTPSATRSSASTTTPTTSKTSSTSSTSSKSSTSSTSSAPPETSSSTTSSTSTPPPPADSDAAVAQFVRSYFHDVTRDRDKTWQELTAKEQDAAGGRDGYEGFWSTIASVSVDELNADATKGRADATLTYTRTDGTTSTERHRLDIVRQGDAYLIDGDHPR
ncbi:MAG: serine/threonine-protein kinase [Angustibacter sp.]